MVNRRRFLGHSCKLGIASATLTSSVLQLALARQAAAATRHPGGLPGVGLYFVRGRQRFVQYGGT
ncbi:MAG: hypothetical protein VB949_17050 [Pseudomonadales bacterium]